jgi:hypothetical protein
LGGGTALAVVFVVLVRPNGRRPGTSRFRIARRASCSGDTSSGAIVVLGIVVPLGNPDGGLTVPTAQAFAGEIVRDIIDFPALITDNPDAHRRLAKSWGQIGKERLERSLPI